MYLCECLIILLNEKQRGPPSIGFSFFVIHDTLQNNALSSHTSSQNTCKTLSFVSKGVFCFTCAYASVDVVTHACFCFMFKHHEAVLTQSCGNVHQSEICLCNTDGDGIKGM